MIQNYITLNRKDASKLRYYNPSYILSKRKINSEVVYVKEDFYEDEQRSCFMGIATLITTKVYYSDTVYPNMDLSDRMSMEPEQGRFFLRITSPALHISIQDTSLFWDSVVANEATALTKFRPNTKAHAYNFEVISKDSALPIIYGRNKRSVTQP